MNKENIEDDIPSVARHTQIKHVVAPKQPNQDVKHKYAEEANEARCPGVYFKKELKLSRIDSDDHKIKAPHCHPHTTSPITWQKLHHHHHQDQKGLPPTHPQDAPSGNQP